MVSDIKQSRNRQRCLFVSSLHHRKPYPFSQVFGRHSRDVQHKQENIITTSSSLPDRTAQRTMTSPATPSKDIIYAIVDYEDAYVQPTILSALQSFLPANRLRLLDPVTGSDAVPNGAKLLQIRAYEAIDFERAASHPDTSLVNSYVIRKALIRKHFLSVTVDHWVAKHPESSLRRHVMRGEALEVDYAEFLEDALVEAWDLRASLERNEETGSGLTQAHAHASDVGEGSASGAQVDGVARARAQAQDQAQTQGCAALDGNESQHDADAAGVTTGPKSPEHREWWILKPSMSDRGQGIRLFSTMEELQGIFDGWDADEPSSDEEEEDDTLAPRGEDRTDYITTSHLRHFVAQPYIHPPLLLPSCENRKFHIRTYVLCAGAMRVYVCREMLALFAGKPYSAPWEKTSSSDGGDSINDQNYLDAHLTNTCIQGSRADALSVQRFWELGDMPTQQKDDVFSQICEVTGELFEAAARGMTVHFQPLPFAFEAYGLDFLVGGDGNVWLLEVNAFPDFRQTGERLRDTVVAEFWRGAVKYGIGPWAGSGEAGAKSDDDGMVLVRDVDLGRK